MRMSKLEATIGEWLEISVVVGLFLTIFTFALACMGII